MSKAMDTCNDQLGFKYDMFVWKLLGEIASTHIDTPALKKDYKRFKSEWIDRQKQRLEKERMVTVPW